MNETELYWSVYKNLEQETIKLSTFIHCSSDQKNVYSMSIADLIVRCVVEIEAISKKIYERLGGDMNPEDDNGNSRILYFDTDCLKLIESEYQISQKEVILSAPTFYFDEEERIIAPLYKADKRGTSGSKWNKAYQALKHDRYGSLKKWGTIECLIYALGALYLLNLYFRDNIYQLKNEFDSFDTRVDSDIFSIYVYDASNVTLSPGVMDDRCINKKEGDCLEKSTYIIKCTDEYFHALYNAVKKDDSDMRKKIINHPQAKKFFVDNPEYKPDSIADLIIDVFGKDSINQLFPLNNVASLLRNRMREAVLNKHQNIYECLF